MNDQSLLAPGTLARALVELADTLVAEFDVVELLTRLTDRCVELLEVTAAGLMLVAPGGDLRVMASSSDAMRMLELFEIQAREGPCLDSYRSGNPLAHGDLLTADDRWPRFAPAARTAGFRSAQAVPMRLRGSVIGALNLFNSNAGSLREEELQVAQAMADIATIAVLQHRAAAEAQVLNEQLSHALTERVAIEQAKGVIAERSGLDMEEAFGALRVYARSHNLRLAVVARDVINGTLQATDIGGPRRGQAAPA